MQSLIAGAELTCNDNSNSAEIPCVANEKVTNTRKESFEVFPRGHLKHSEGIFNTRRGLIKIP